MLVCNVTSSNINCYKDTIGTFLPEADISDIKDLEDTVDVTQSTEYHENSNSTLETTLCQQESS